MIATKRRLPERLVTIMVVSGVIAVGSPGSALAVEPPHIDRGALALGVPVAPPEDTEQRLVCAQPSATGLHPPDEASAAQRSLDLGAAWQFSRGAGQRVAVIDTGVTRHPRLAALEPGGDYVSDSDGTSDCDGHGTLVAGIIAAQPSSADAFSGVAPDATIIAIRQSSSAFEPKDNRQGEAPGATSTGVGDVTTLAHAVVHAVDLGATVINISEVACAPATAGFDDRILGAAVQYAFERNVVVVAAAGNIGRDSRCSDQNPGPDPRRPDDGGWPTVSTVASPAWYTPYVLSVGAVTDDGSPAAFSLHGPWISVAAPGSGIVSLDSAPGAAGLVDSVQGQDGYVPIEGTSFAAPYVSGLVALVRSRFPELSASQVIDRVTTTARAPGTGRDDAIGYGIIDPLAALTAPERSPVATVATGTPMTMPAATPPADTRARTIGVIGACVCAIALLFVWVVSAATRRRRRIDPLEDL